MDRVTPAVVCLSQSGLATARAAALALAASVHGLDGRVTGADVEFSDTMGHLRALFAAGVPIIGVCSAGILIRALSSALSDKWAEPAVLAVAEDASSIIPLLGGHHGANAIARKLADVLGGHAGITTASDTVHGVPLDEPPAGWKLANPECAKVVAARILGGEHVRLEGEALKDAYWLAALPKNPDAALQIVATDRYIQPSEERLVYHPANFALGVGCARNCDAGELSTLVRETLERAGIASGAIAAVVTIDIKADEPAVLALAGELGVPVRVFDAETLEAQSARLANPSEVVFAEVGCHGVSEGAALAAAGLDGELAVEKHKSANATCALARAVNPITELPGRKPGQVAMIGIGPGQADWRTPEASKLIADADELIGYGLYIDLLGPLAAGKPRHDFALGEEEGRCRFALERAGEGRDVAVICSGDAGIYAMSALAYELLDRPADRGGVSDAARRVGVVSAPGVSALQAAAARAGAPLGHDFCAISLSDLLTSRETIVQRIKAAAEGDFVIAFYNPVSKRRRTLLSEARDMLLEHRPRDTPVLLASNLGRPEERLIFRHLSDLHVDEVDMLTVVLIGSSQSRMMQRGEGLRIYTPRGYAKRIDGALARNG